MKCNVGKNDCRVRFFAGLALVTAGIMGHSPWGLLGVPLIASSYAGWCSLYRLLGISTDKK